MLQKNSRNANFEKGAKVGSRYCWWLKSGYHQLMLVVYSTIYKCFTHPRWFSRRISEPSKYTTWTTPKPKAPHQHLEHPLKTGVWHARMACFLVLQNFKTSHKKRNVLRELGSLWALEAQNKRLECCCCCCCCCCWQRTTILLFV